MFIGDQPMDLMVDTSAHHSMVTQPVSPLFKKKQTTIVGATGYKAHHPFLLPGVTI